MAQAFLVIFPFLFWFNNSNHFRMIFPKTREIEEPCRETVRNDKKSWDSRQNRESLQVWVCVCYPPKNPVSVTCIILQSANPKYRVVKTSFIEQECKEIYVPFDFGSISINQVFPEGKEAEEGHGDCHHKDPETLTPIESHNPKIRTELNWLESRLEFPCRLFLSMY